ncbi:DUF3352 domain-containing protein [Gimesia fumaroli]|uniref:DUF3352 domain-containing protein n=1 Tax=Gimesia fumaroli TaxID=2527976 RepID=A0A518I842_9PLAN|nr:DUF3352 domain-containing protein [Gimesia fumaroli]QDV49258.1 hypothetical protein Enr17x_12750 [Gimesia fumaroli]
MQPMKQYPAQLCLTVKKSTILAMVLVSVVFISLGSAAAVAETPLSQLVDDKAGVYVEASDLNGHLKQFLVSPVVTRFQQTQVFQSWLISQDVKNLKQGLRDVESVTEQRLFPLLNNLFGESVGLAVFNNGPKQTPSPLLLARVKKASATKSLFESWFKKTGVTVTSINYQKVPCFIASQSGADSDTIPQIYYTFLERTLVVTENKHILQSTVDLYVKQTLQKQPRDAQASLFNLKIYQRAQSKLSPNVTGSLFLNPRIWDEHIKPPKNEVEKGVVNWWHKTGGLIVGLHLKNTVALETVILFNSEAINLPLLDALQVPTEIPEKYTLVPKKALAVLCGQLNIHLLTQKVVDFYANKNPEKWQKFHAVSVGLLGGLDPVTEFAKALGPNVLFYSVPRKELSFDAISFDGLVALQITNPDQPAIGADKSQYQTALENVANFLMNSMLAHHNAHLKQDTSASILKIEDHELFQMRWIDSIGPYRPAYGINEQQIVFASSPELVKEFFTLKSEESLAALPLFQTWKETFFQQEKQLCFLNISSIRAFIDQNSDFLAKQLAQGQDGDIEKGRKKLSGLKGLLQSFDGLFLAAGLQKTQVRIIMGLGSLDPVN